MSEWEEVTLGEVITFKRGHDLSKKNMRNGTVPVAGSSGIVGFHDASTTEKPAVIIGRSGSIGQVYWYDDFVWAHNTALNVEDFQGNDQRFIFYWLHQFDFTRFNTGSAVPSLNRNHLHQIQCTVPPLKSQEAIAEVLRSLDDKIDLLKRQNKTLEGMAEALFRQWFIEEAQDDWEEVELQDLYKIKIGRTPPRKESEWFEDIESSQNWPWFSIKDMADCGTFISDSSEFITSEGQEKFKIPIIPPRTVVLSFKLTVGRVAITKRPMLSNEAIAHFIPSTTAPSDLVLFCFLKSLNYQSLGSTSSIAQAVNSGTIRKIQMPKFPQSVINRFDVLCSQWFDKINYNQEQLKVLKKKRDTLLPKLMSGEVRIQMD